MLDASGNLSEFGKIKAEEYIEWALKDHLEKIRKRERRRQAAKNQRLAKRLNR